MPPTSPHIDDDAHYLPLYQEGRDDWQIAEATGDHIDRVRRWRVRSHLPRHYQRRPRPLVRHAGHFALLHNAGKAPWQIAEETGAPLATVKRWMLYHRIEPHVVPTPVTANPLHETLLALYTKEHLPDTELACRVTALGTFGTVSVGRVRRWRTAHQLPKHRKPSAADLRYMPYYEERYSDRQIAAVTNRTISTICLWRLHHDPPLPPHLARTDLPAFADLHAKRGA